MNEVTRPKPRAAWADVVTKPRCFATRLHSATDLPPGWTSLFEQNFCLRIIVCNQIWNAPSISQKVLAYLEMSPKANSHRKRKEPAKVHTIIYWCLLFRKSESCEKCQGQLGSAQGYRVCRCLNLVQTHKCSLLILIPHPFQIKLY